MAITCDVKWGFYNLVDQSTTDISATSENAFFPASNIQHPFASKVYRSATGTNTASVVFDFKTVEDVDMILVRPDLNSGFGFTGSLTIEANIIDSWASPIYSTTLTVDNSLDLGIKLLDTVENYRFWRITGTGNDYFELSNIFIGKYFETEKNISINWKCTDKSLDKISSNAFGNDFITINGRLRDISADIKFLDKTGMKDLDDNFSFVSTNKAVWIVMDPLEGFSSDIELFAGQFRLSKIGSWTNVSYGLYNISINLREFK
jgi:hypothetical protein